MKKNLAKTKIVLENNGKSIVIYVWEKTFWKFGYWTPCGVLSSINPLSEDKYSKIDNKTVSTCLFDNFLEQRRNINK